MNDETAIVPSCDELVRMEVAAGLRALDQTGRLFYGAVLSAEEVERAVQRKRSSPEWVGRIVELHHQMMDRGMFVRSKSNYTTLTIVPIEQMPRHAIQRTRTEKKRRERRLRGLAAVPRTKLTAEEVMRFDRAEQKLAVMILQDGAIINRRTNFPELNGETKNVHK